MFYDLSARLERLCFFVGKQNQRKRKRKLAKVPKDYVYFLHNHVVPLHSFEEAIENLKEYSVEENKDLQQTVTMCMKCQGLDKVVLR